VFDNGENTFADISQKSVTTYFPVFPFILFFIITHQRSSPYTREEKRLLFTHNRKH